MGPLALLVKRTYETGHCIGIVQSQGCSPLKGVLAQRGLREFVGSSTWLPFVFDFIFSARLS